MGRPAGQLGIEGNFAADPLFCDAAAEDFPLHSDSPCAGINNPACGHLGAWPIGCGDVSHALALELGSSRVDCAPNPFSAWTRTFFRIGARLPCGVYLCRLSQGGRGQGEVKALLPR